MQITCQTDSDNMGKLYFLGRQNANVSGYCFGGGCKKCRDPECQHDCHKIGKGTVG